MLTALYALFSRVRTLLGLLPALLRKLFRMKPREEEFTPQRMCPFCGLITARHKRFCLECGKSLKPA
jgi:ribosomal protein S27AE